jgi:hypothetical protein
MAWGGSCQTMRYLSPLAAERVGGKRSTRRLQGNKIVELIVAAYKQVEELATSQDETKANETIQ